MSFVLTLDPWILKVLESFSIKTNDHSVVVILDMLDRILSPSDFSTMHCHQRCLLIFHSFSHGFPRIPLVAVADGGGGAREEKNPGRHSRSRFWFLCSHDTDVWPDKASVLFLQRCYRAHWQYQGADARQAVHRGTPRGQWYVVCLFLDCPLAFWRWQWQCPWHDEISKY